MALVTGASAGIGAAICKMLASHGINVVGCARREDRVKEFAKEFPLIRAYKVSGFFAVMRFQEKQTNINK